MSVELKGEYRLFIGGEWAVGVSGETFESLNPATGEPLVRVTAGNAEDVDRAVALIKWAVQEGLEMPLNAGLALERELQNRLFVTRDAQEGLSAFVEKRKPEFVGE